MAKVNKVLYNLNQRNDTTVQERTTARNNIDAAANIAVSTTNDGLMTSTDKIKLDSIASGAEVNVQSDWAQIDTNADDYIKNKPDIPEMEWVQHNQGGDTNYEANKLTIDQDYLSVILQGTEVGSATLGKLVPIPTNTPDKDKVLHLASGSEVPQWTDMPEESVVYVYLTDTYETVLGHVNAGKEVILRVWPTEDNPLYQDFRLMQYNPDGSMEFSCVTSGYGTIFTYKYMLYSNGVWQRTNTSATTYQGILINGIGRNLHLNQNNYVQTNFPGGVWNAPTTMSSNFTAITGSDFAGAFRLGCKYYGDTYQLAIIYTAHGTTGSIQFIGTETIIGTDNSCTVNQAVYNESVLYTPVYRFGYSDSTPFNPNVHKAIIYDGIALIGPCSDCKIAIWNDDGTVKIGMTSIEVGKVGSTV